MPAHSAEQLSKGNLPIDITSTRRNNAPIQSHLSVTTSLNRIRISPNWYTSFPKERIHDLGEIPRSKKTDIRTDGLSENNLRGGRQDRTCGKLIARYTLIGYCFLSCVIATCRLYSFFFIKPHTPEPLTQDAVRLPTMEMSGMTNYLLKAIPCCTTTFEPFVLSNNHKPEDSGVSFVGWLNESVVDSIRVWSTRWPGMSVPRFRSLFDGLSLKGPISVLVTTTAVPSSPSHSELLRKIRTYSGITGLSVHLLFVQPDLSPTPNLYMNLARLVSTTNWTFLFPGDASHPTASDLYQSVTRLSLENVEDPIVLTPGSNSYPFPSLSPILIKRAHSFWCTERMFLNVSRMSDWDECLWQVALETFGKSKVSTVRSVKGGLSSTPKVCRWCSYCTRY